MGPSHGENELEATIPTKQRTILNVIRNLHFYTTRHVTWNNNDVNTCWHVGSWVIRILVIEPLGSLFRMMVRLPVLRLATKKYL